MTLERFLAVPKNFWGLASLQNMLFLSFEGYSREFFWDSWKNPSILEIFLGLAILENVYSMNLVSVLAVPKNFAATFEYFLVLLQNSFLVILTFWLWRGSYQCSKIFQRNLESFLFLFKNFLMFLRRQATPQNFHCMHEFLDNSQKFSGDHQKFTNCSWEISGDSRNLIVLIANSIVLKKLPDASQEFSWLLLRIVCAWQLSKTVTYCCLRVSWQFLTIFWWHFNAWQFHKLFTSWLFKVF